MVRFTLLVGVLLFFFINCAAQNTPDSSGFLGYVKMAPSTKYEASGSRQFFWGKHYRKEWATESSFPILNMATYKGGLTPDKMGGGHQSKSLRVISGDGKEYVL